MNQTEYEKIKRDVRGFYHGFNTSILKTYIRRCFDYEELMNTAHQFETLEEFYKHHTFNRELIIDEQINEMYETYKGNYAGLTVDLITNCLKVRIGNIYNGCYTEHKIIESLKGLEDWILCEKADDLTDKNHKVDAIVTLVGIDQIGIQIKPLSFTKYDTGSEKSAHEQFTIERGMKVYYLFYRDRFNIVFNGKEMKLNDKQKIVDMIITLVYSS